MSENNGSNFAPGEWYYSGSTSVSDITQRGAPEPAPAPLARTSAPEPAITVNTQPALSQRDTASVYQPVKPHGSEQRQQAQVMPTHGAGAYFNPLVLPIQEADQPIFASFAKVLGEYDVDPKVGPAIFNWYRDLIAAGDREQAAADEQQRRSNAAALQRHWGSNFTKNVEEAFRLVDHLTDVDTADSIFNSRDPSGQLLGNNPGFLRWLHSLANGRNTPNAQVAAGYGGGNVPAAGDEAELADLRKQMGNSRSEYWSGKNAEALQQRYRELVSRNG